MSSSSSFSSSSSAIPQLLPKSILPTYTTSHRRLLLFDYDGTLTPIVADPTSAILSIETSQQLNLLANNPKNKVWVISGRDCAFLDEHIAKVCPNLGLCAEHGAFIRYPQDVHWRDLTASEDWGWRPYVAARFEALVKELPGSAFETKRAALAWHYRRAAGDPEVVATRAREVARDLREGLEYRDPWKVDVVEGKCVVEVRARGLNKGRIVEELMSRAKDDDGWDFVACWGADTTDEDMFRALKRTSLVAHDRAFPVKVGDGTTETSAEYLVAAPKEVHACIEWLNNA